MEGTKKKYEAETDPEERARPAAMLDRFERTKESYPFCEEPCFHGLGFSLGEAYMLSAFGVENEDGDEVDSLISPYDQTKLETIPCIYSIDL